MILWEPRLTALFLRSVQEVLNKIKVRPKDWEKQLCPSPQRCWIPLVRFNFRGQKISFKLHSNELLGFFFPPCNIEMQLLNELYRKYMNLILSVKKLSVVDRVFIYMTVFGSYKLCSLWRRHDISPLRNLYLCNKTKLKTTCFMSGLGQNSSNLKYLSLDTTTTFLDPLFSGKKYFSGIIHHILMQFFKEFR